ncbi:DUF3307 domain-containing protein [Fusobacterium ulcerans]|uniref:DUF3307 domain-containing protein n=1 Tax=Fusobacterium ulcerans TaxID=861 RepID=UPI000E490D53|nr:DUF3307 domain-containing protein [Fusobacterium ulcerans]RGY66689.1 DUF3307 domain-containing protein [Fusobacterium ulcerans]
MKEIIFLGMAHIFGDYVFQTDFMAKFKGENNYILFNHSWMWTACIYICFFILGKELNLLQCLFFLIGHMAIDKWKCERKDKTKSLTVYLWIDQLLHFIQIAIVYAWLK